MVNSDNFFHAIDWIVERHRVWEKRQAGEPQPWTTHSVLQYRKFTNVFRLLDPGSQFFITDLIHPDPVETLARAWLYRHTNLPYPWRVARADLNGYPALTGFGGIQEVFEVFSEYREAGNPWSSGAYRLRPESEGGKSVIGGDKMEFVFRRCREIFVEGRDNIVVDFFDTDSIAERIEILKRSEGVADFMAQQINTDFGYSTPFREDEHIVPGPGSIRGAEWLWPGKPTVEVIRWLHEEVTAADWCPTIEVSDGRVFIPSAMDIQNCLCEIGKLSKELGKPDRRTHYKPAHPGVQPTPVLPKLWTGVAV